jgi:hypothetical protein
MTAQAGQLFLELTGRLEGDDYLRRWADFLHNNGTGVGEARISDLERWTTVLHQEGVPEDEISSITAHIRALYASLARRGVPVSMSMLPNKLSDVAAKPSVRAPSTGNGSRRASAQGPSSSVVRSASPATARTPTDGIALLTAFAQAARSVNTATGRKVAVGKWLRFLDKRGVEAMGASTDDYKDWAAQLRSSGIKETSIGVYTNHINAFYRWLAEPGATVRPEMTQLQATLSSKARTGSRRRSRPNPGPSTVRTPTDGIALLTAFAQAARSVNTATGRKVAVGKWLRFLDKRGVEAMGASTDDYKDWAAQLRSSGIKETSIGVYTNHINAFYRWLAEPGATVRPEMTKLSAGPRTMWGETSASRRPRTVDVLEELKGTSDAHERRLNELSAKVSMWEQKWGAVRDEVSEAVGRLLTAAHDVRAGCEEQLDWAKEIEEIAKKVKATIYQQADEGAKAFLSSQPRATGSCLGEVETLINHGFAGLETSNEAIIDYAAELDKAPQGATWAGKLHLVLLALSDYTCSGFDGDFKRYCEKAPCGHNVVPATWVAPHEPAATSDNKRFREERTFPVSLIVDPDGKRYMPEHIILGSGGISPRLHYYDDRKGPTGKVHVGYLGEHLQSRDTN